MLDTMGSFLGLLNQYLEFPFEWIAPIGLDARVLKRCV